MAIEDWASVFDGVEEQSRQKAMTLGRIGFIGWAL
jgi:hypothetical protein